MTDNSKGTSLLHNEINYECKSFMIQAPGPKAVNFLLKLSKIVHNKIVFDPGMPYQPSLKSAIRLELTCSTLGSAPSLTHRHYIRLGRPARGKYSILLQTFVYYSRKMVYYIRASSLYYKAF